MAWLYTPRTAVSTSELDLSNVTIELFVTLSGKQVARPISWHGWQRRNYIKLLFGTIAEPLMASRGVERLISSLRASRAQRSALPASEKALKVNGGFGAMLPELFAKHDRNDCFLKTSEGSLLPMMDAPTVRFLETWPKSGLMSGGEVYQLRDLGPGTVATDCSTWPTPTANNEKGGGTAIVRTDGKSRLDQLHYAAENWATPCATDSQSINAGKQNRSLRSDVQLWATPIANDAEKRGNANVSGLTGMAVAFRSRRLDRMQMMLGSKSLEKRLPRLSPHFTEWLMGLPKGWTDYECAETGFTRWQLHMRGWLDKLPLPPQLSWSEAIEA